MKKFTSLLVLCMSVITIAYSQNVELSYDNDGAFTDYQALVPERVFAVKMSPTGPCEVIAMKFLVKKEGLSEAGFIPLLYNWEETQPSVNAVYESISAVILDDWKEVNVNGTITFDGDFVVGFKPNDPAAYLAYDGDLQNGRNWILDITNGTWTEETSHSYLIRAIVEYTGSEGPSSTEELEGEVISIYPNPVAEMLNIKIDNNDVQSLSLINSVGQVVYYTQDIAPGLIKLDISKFTSGLYFLQISAKNDSSMQKVIIQ